MSFPNRGLFILALNVSTIAFIIFAMLNNYHDLERKRLPPTVVGT